MDNSNSNANLPDSWDSIEDPGPGEEQSIDTQFKGLNVNASPFVPNVFAAAFVPKTQPPKGNAFILINTV